MYDYVSVGHGMWLSVFVMLVSWQKDKGSWGNSKIALPRT